MNKFESKAGILEKTLSRGAFIKGMSWAVLSAAALDATYITPKKASDRLAKLVDVSNVSSHQNLSNESDQDKSNFDTITTSDSMLNIAVDSTKRYLIDGIAAAIAISNLNLNEDSHDKESFNKTT